MYLSVNKERIINDCHQTHRSAAINLKYWLDFTPTLCLSYFNLSFTNLNLHEQVRRIFSLQHFSIFCSTKLIKVFLFTKFLLTFFLKKCGHKFYSVSTYIGVRINWIFLNYLMFHLFLMFLKISKISVFLWFVNHQLIL